MTDFSKLKLLATELSIFFTIQFFGLLIASLLINNQSTINLPQITVLSFAVGFAITTFFILAAIKFLKTGVGFKLLFIFLIVYGSKVVFESFMHPIPAYILSLVVLIFWLAAPLVIVHNFVILLAIGGISAQLGLSMEIIHVLILFAALSIYDVIAVYKTQHMVKMFKALINHGVYLAIIVPFRFKGFLLNTKKAAPGKDFLMLGTGDIAFPLILAASCLRVSLISSLLVILGAAAGLVVIFYMLVNQTERKAMPALPPIALGSFIGYLISIFVLSVL